MGSDVDGTVAGIVDTGFGVTAVDMGDGVTVVGGTTGVDVGSGPTWVRVGSEVASTTEGAGEMKVALLGAGVSEPRAVSGVLVKETTVGVGVITLGSAGAGSNVMEAGVGSTVLVGGVGAEVNEVGRGAYGA